MRSLIMPFALLLAACNTGAGNGGPGSEPPRAPAQTPADSPGSPAPGTPAAAGDTVRVGDLRFTASTAVLESFPVQLRTTVEVVNTGTTAATLEFPSGCTVLLRAYRSRADAEPAWDQALAVMCTMAIQIVTLQAGERASYATAADAREILGDSLPDGTYHLRAWMSFNGTSIEVPAGSVQLAIPR